MQKGKGMVQGVPWRARSGFGLRDGAGAERGSFPARSSQLHNHRGAVPEGCKCPEDLPRGPLRNPTVFLLRDDFFLSATLLSLEKNLAQTARSAQSSNTRQHCTKTHRFSSLGRRPFGRDTSGRGSGGQILLPHGPAARSAQGTAPHRALWHEGH